MKYLAFNINQKNIKHVWTLRVARVRTRNNKKINNYETLF